MTFRPAQTASAPRRTLQIVNLRVSNIEIPSAKRIETSLQYIFGIGEATSKMILIRTGVENKKTFELDDEEIKKIREMVEGITTEADLRRIIMQNIKRLKEINCYRGRRHIMGLPVRGQRTKTNARTRKGKAKAIAGKKKVTK
jgi:small subunit ribosomal protein S13